MVKTRKAPAKAKGGKAAVKVRSKPSAASKSTKPPAKKKAAPASAGSTKAVRLTFSYDGPAVKLVSQDRVEMTVPPTDPLKGFGKQKGFWAELRNKQDKTLYRQVIHNPTRNDAEVFPDPDESPEQSIAREAAPKRKGVFVVLVPDTDEGDSVTMCRSPLDKTGPGRGIRAFASKPAIKFRRFKLMK
ncbi:MAG: hypothetical protein H7Z16_03420 [Pyrinomonadaceae bacterium]|nr:hypothetical protein [Pyrinomonadaceae bacterium]